jgi:hypothetical protein
MEAGDFFLLLLWLDEAEVELLVLDPDDPEEKDPRLRRPRPRAHLDMACSITEGMILNRIPLDEEEEDELEMDVFVAIKLKDRDVEGWTLVGVRGSGPL